MRRRWLKRTLWAALLLGVVLAVLLAVLLNSRAGAQWTIDRLVAMSGADISHAPVSGSLWRGISLPQLAYRDEVREVQLEEVALAIRWSKTTPGKLVLATAQVRDVRHREFGAKGSGEPFHVALPQWPFTLCVERLRAENVLSGSGESETQINTVAISEACIDGDEHHLSADSLGLQTLGVSARATRIEADVNGQVPLTAELNWNYSEQGWSGSGPLSGTLALIELEQDVSGPYPMAATGTVAPFDGPKPLLDIRATWQEWLAGDLLLRDGNAHAAGELEDYTLAYSFTAVLPEVPDLSVTGSGSGDLDGLSIVDAELQSIIGNARFLGEVTWQDDIRSSGSLTVDGFDPNWLHGSLSGSLGGSAGMTLPGDDSVRFDNIAVTGRLNGQQMSLSGAAEARTGLVRCSSCRLVAGGNEVFFDGDVESDVIGADLEIRAPSLQAILPGLSGRLNAEGRLTGPLISPVFTGRAGGTDIAYAGWTLARMNINSGSVGAEEIRFSLLAQDLSYEGSPPARVSANASGRFDALDLEFEWSSPWLNAEAEAGLAVAGAAVSGTVRTARVAEPLAGTWLLEAPIGFSFDPAGATATGHLWRRAGGEPGAESELQVRSLSLIEGVSVIDVSLLRWPLEALSALLPAPDRQRLGGTADADLDVRFQDGTWTGSLQWRQSDTLLTAQVPGADEARIRIPKAWLNAELAGGGASASARMEIEPDVTLELQLNADRVSPAASIDGSLALAGSDWSWISSVIPDIDRIEGAVSANLGLSGPLLAPAINGRLDWTQGKLMIPILNVLLEDIEFSLEGEPNAAASFSGQANAGEGRLEIQGRLESLLTPDRKISLQINGDTARLMDWPEYRAWVSPEISVTSGEEGWEVRGVLGLPKAEVRLRELPEEAVTISEDVKVLGADEPETRPTRYYGSARLVLGEQVRVQLFGLDTRLEGELRLRQPKDRPPTARGEVKLVGGTFEAYGQKLEIEEGTLLFTGPFDNPVVDVKAIRVIETFDGEVKAGIHLQGRALNLASRVYSVPAMSEADALSYLVIGRPLSQVSDAESLDVSNAALALSLAQASKVTQQIGSTIGLDQLSLVGDGGEGTALVAGKQVNKRLYARYAYGVFSRLGTLLLRYKLSKRVAIEATSGERQSLDILYTVEKY